MITVRHRFVLEAGHSRVRMSARPFAWLVRVEVGTALCQRATGVRSRDAYVDVPSCQARAAKRRTVTNHDIASSAVLQGCTVRACSSGIKDAERAVPSWTGHFCDGGGAGQLNGSTAVVRDRHGAVVCTRRPIL